MTDERVEAASGDAGRRAIGSRGFVASHTSRRVSGRRRIEAAPPRGRSHVADGAARGDTV